MNTSYGNQILQLPLESSLRKKQFLEILKNPHESILFDGGVASLLYERGVFINRSFDEVVLSQPELVTEVHADYLAAGSQVITTNTFSANPFKLAAFGLQDKVTTLNHKAAGIARESAGSQAWVAGCIGPLGVRIEPWGPTSFDEAREAFKIQAKALQEGGVDLFVLESFGDLNEIQQALLAIQELSEPYPIVAMMSTNDEGESLYGTPASWFIQKLADWGADLVGINGGAGPASLLELLPSIKSATQKPLILKPKAGEPRVVDGRVLYMASPEYLGEFAKNALHKGVKAIGGCSGINPPHIRAMCGAIRQNRAFFVSRKDVQIPLTTPQRIPSPVPAESQSRWAQAIERKEFVVCLELLPPKGLNPEKLIERARYCQSMGVHAINIPDGPRASARMSAMAAAVLIEREVGIETIMHYACRDRNLLGIQSDLIGAAGLGLKNILCVTGDPPKMGPYPNATPVFDIDAIGLVNMCSRLNTGHDLGGASLGVNATFSVGVGANPVAANQDTELKRFHYKVEAGAHWAITQPIFEESCLMDFLEKTQDMQIPIIAGIWPFSSLRNAEFMANEVPGVVVPKRHIERIARFTQAEDQAAAGMEIAQELVAKIRPHVQGLQISAPLGRVEFALQLINPEKMPPA